MQVYTDGAALTNPGRGGWAWWVSDNAWGSGSLPHATNQQAELLGILVALRCVPMDVELEIVSDSQYALDSVLKWIPGWKRKNWRTSQKTIVANLGIMLALDAAVQARQAPWSGRWVRGHTGVPGNEHADMAAGAAARKADNTGPGVFGPGWPGSNFTVGQVRDLVVASLAPTEPPGTPESLF